MKRWPLIRHLRYYWLVWHYERCPPPLEAWAYVRAVWRGEA